MITGIVLLSQLLTVSGIVRDGANGAPIPSVSIAAPGQATHTNASGEYRITVSRGDTLFVRRIGYRARRVQANDARLDIALFSSTQALPAVAVIDAAQVARAVIAVAPEDLHGAANRSAADVIATAPFVSARSARGQTAIALRGSRPEQTQVLLDGMVLNDPATGRGTLDDVPASFIGGATISPGASGVENGSGAVGGVVSLATTDESSATISMGAFGEWRVEGLSVLPTSRARLRVGISAAGSPNEYEFRNSEAATGQDSLERRRNEDWRRTTALLGASATHMQVMAIATEEERGLAGPMNVHDFADHDRARRTRIAAHGSSDLFGVVSTASVRSLRLAYRNSAARDLDGDLRALAMDMDASRSIARVAMRAGVGRDELRDRNLEPAARLRGFGSIGYAGSVADVRTTIGVRADAIEQSGLRPSMNAGLERGASRIVYARFSQAFRAPTLADMYEGSAQRVGAAPVRPERVQFDVETGLRGVAHGAALSLSAYGRRIADAIVWFPGVLGQWNPVNAERESAWGLEGRTSWTRGRWRASAWASRTTSQLHIGTLDIPTPYVATWAAGGDAGIGGRAARLTTRLHAVSRRPFAQAPRSRANELPGVALIDLRGEWRLRSLGTHALVLTSAIDNVGDVEWESVRRYPTPGRTWSVALSFTQESSR